MYCRISLDSTGEGLGVQRQQEACRAWADARGWSVAEVYVDNSISASKPEVNRPAYRRMLRDLEDGTRDAVVAYAPDRLTRQTRQLLDLVELAQAKDFPIGTVQGELDLATPQGRTMALIAARFAQQEAEQKGERQRVANAQRLKAGKAYGRKRVFGWADKAKTELHPVEAPALQKACADILAGKSTAEIAAEWNEHGPAPLGKTMRSENPRWWNSTVYTVLTRPANAGIVTYKGEEVPEVEAEWVPIVSRETYVAVKAKMGQAEPVKRRKPHKYLLTGLITCAKCGVWMNASNRQTGPAYLCSSAHCYSSIQQHIAEEEVTRYVVGALNSMKPSQLLPDEDRRRQASISAELLELEQERFDVASMKLALKSRAALLEDIDKRETELREKLSQLTRGNALGEAVAHVLPWVSGGKLDMPTAAASLAAVRDAFDGLSLSQKRLIVSAVGEYAILDGRQKKRVRIFPKDPRTGEVSKYSIDEDPHALES